MVNTLAPAVGHRPPPISAWRVVPTLVQSGAPHPPLPLPPTHLLRRKYWHAGGPRAVLRGRQKRRLSGASSPNAPWEEERTGPLVVLHSFIYGRAAALGRAEAPLRLKICPPGHFGAGCRRLLPPPTGVLYGAMGTSSTARRQHSFKKETGRKLNLSVNSRITIKPQRKTIAGNRSSDSLGRWHADSQSSSVIPHVVAATSYVIKSLC